MQKIVKQISLRGTRFLIAWFVIVIALLIAFSHNSKKNMNTVIQENLLKELSAYGSELDSDWRNAEGATEIAGKFLSEAVFPMPTGDSSVVKTLQALQEMQGISKSVYYRTNGKCITADGEVKDWELSECTEMLQGDMPFFTYLKCDSRTEGAVPVYVYPINRQQGVVGYIVSYLKTDVSLDKIRENTYKNQVFLFVSDYEGNVLYFSGDEAYRKFVSNNLWDNLESHAQSEPKWFLFERQLEKKESGSTVITSNNEEFYIVSAPIESADWVLLMGITEDYLKYEESLVWGKIDIFPVLIGLTLLGVLATYLYFNLSTGRYATEHSKEMEDKADTDQLTGLYNKMATERKIKEYMQKYPDSQALMVIVDVDNFKKINDTMGHSFGDEVLSRLGVQMQSMFRVTDIIGRTGGDEFIVFLKRINDDAIIVREGKKLEQFFEHFEVGEYVKYSVTASLGAAVFPRDASDFESLYKAADKALYVAKGRGKNQLAFYGDDKQETEK